ncbi:MULTISPECIES: hypothetical protein [unclassified Haladaptatus]|uniref:DUF7501 family protein n=1 Tax=unclassified Haladaptatus TaxID=2622732 RepID=UPI0023E7A8DA|nr:MULTISPECIES: hypothetical protein [unclassified Haladaptatus]
MAYSAEPSTTTPVWRDPEHCPFCGAELVDGGPAFMAHIDDSQSCNQGFSLWRQQVADDIGSEWGG